MVLVTLSLLSMSLATIGAPTAGAAEKCAGVETAIIKCNNNVDDSKVETSGVWQILKITLQIMTAGVGVLAVLGIVYGSILYTTAGDKAEQTKKAVSIIINVAIGIIAYGSMFLLLNFLIPGGVLSSS